MAEENSSVLPDGSSACALSPATSSTTTPRDMQMKLQMWKQEKAARAAQERAAKSQKPQPFRVPCTTRTDSPLRARAAVSSENVTCAPPQAKTPSKRPVACNRSALTERCPNTEQRSIGNATCPRSVSPVLNRYNPPQRSLRTKTPEPTRTIKTPERRCAPKTPEPQKIISCGQPTAEPSQAQTEERHEPSPPKRRPARTEQPAVEPSPTTAARNMEVQVAAEARQETLVTSSGEIQSPTVELNSHSHGADVALQAPLEENITEADDVESKPILAIGATSTASPPPPMPRRNAPPVPEEPPPELHVVEPLSQESLEELSDGVQSSSTSSDDHAACSQTQEANADALTNGAEAGLESVLAETMTDAISEPALADAQAHAAVPGSPTATGGSPLAAYLPATTCSPPASSCNLLAAYLPSSSPFSGANPSDITTIGGGLLAAYEERAALPKMPPPSPATPSATLAFSLATASAIPVLANAEAAEFARAAGAALVRLAVEDTATPSQWSTMGPTPNAPELRSPVSSLQRRVSHPLSRAEGLEEENLHIEEPLSPLSLESGSPEPSAGRHDLEDVNEVKLES